ncbi:L-rhamnose mutarotase [Gordonia rhizosphera]|uniref:L-rhamnose mutarotase n=1 Tax=Gordonia rhizosphera NBRC 16068 TaxID=1108045 RepID=K6WM15_9ACTN|nr:L-rhamnose mutarotase [Gordonia rhizosphera]GAB93192.1 hypothetical protein GORHZ_209_00270 [Gordonia rhizosphera NBRC 16068]
MKVALHTRLRPSTVDDYERAHGQVPAELMAAIRRAGATEWSIWRNGLDLFHVIDCEDYQRLLADLRDVPVNIEWQARMDGLLDVAHDYSSDGSAAVLPLVWHLGGSE